MSDHNLLLLGFDDQAACRRAYEEAKQLPGLRQAAVMERSADGLVDVPESHVRGAGVATVGSGVVGGLVGMLAGPIGMLLGAAAGAVLGNAAEEAWAMDGGAGLILLSSRVENGTALLVVDLTESSPGPADELAARYGAGLERVPAEEFAERVRDAREAARKAADEESDGGAGDGPAAGS